jgi:hypothetical protein
MERERIVQFNVYLPFSVAENFREMVARKHGYVRHGLISYEAKEAFNSWIATSNTQAQSTQSLPSYSKINPAPWVHDAKQKMMNCLVESGAFEEVPQQVPTSLLVQAIENTQGHDKRTIKKWTDLFKKYGCIKQIGVYQWEIT